MNSLLSKITLLLILLSLSTSTTNTSTEENIENIPQPETAKNPKNDSENLELNKDEDEDEDSLSDDDDNFNNTDYNDDFNYSDYNYNDSDLNVSDYDDSYDDYYDDPYRRGDYDPANQYSYEDEQKKSVCCSLIVQEAMKNNRQQLKDVINRIKKAKSKTVIEKIKSDLSKLCVDNIKKDVVEKYMKFYETAEEIEFEESDNDLMNLDYNKYKTEADLASDYSVENVAEDIRDAENNFIENHPKFKRLFAQKKNNNEMEIDPKYKNRAFLMVVGVIGVTVLCMFGNLILERYSVKEKDS